MKKEVKQLKPVMILDCHRGIYFGYLKKITNKNKTVELENARHCFYYSVAECGHKGVYGLATVGPSSSSKIGPRVDMVVNDVSKIVDVKKEAVEKWEKGSW